MRGRDAVTRAARAWLGVAMLCLFLPAHALSISGFKNDLVSFLLEKVSVPGELEIKADRIATPASGGTELNGVRFVDAEGTFFTARRFAFTWSPARLLKGEVQIDRLVLEGGRLERLPVGLGGGEAPAARASSSPAGWPRSPITLRIAELVIDEMWVGEKILPQAIAFSALGSMQDEGPEQSLILGLERTDGIDGTIRVSYRKRFDNDSLSLDVDAREAPGGLVAALAGLPAGIPARLKVKGAGTAEAWNGGLELGAEGLLALAGRLEASWASRLKAGLEVELRPGPRLAGPVRDALGARAALEVTLSEDDHSRVLVERARIRGAAVSATARGHYDRAASAVDLELAIEVAEANIGRLNALIAPASIGPGRFEVSARGPLGALVIAGDGTVARPALEGFSAEEARLRLRVAADAAGPVDFSVEAALHGPRGPSPSYGPALGEAMTLALRGRHADGVVTLDEAIAKGAAFSASLSGEVGTAGGLEPRLAYRIAVPELALIAGIYEADVTGGARGEGRIFPTSAGAVGLAGRIDLSEAVVNRQALGRVRLEHAATFAQAVSGRFAMSFASPAFGDGRAEGAFEAALGQVRITELELDLLSIAARGDARVPLSGPRGPEGRFRLDVRSLEPLGRLAGVSLDGRGHAVLELLPGDGGRAVLEAEILGLAASDASIGVARIEASVARLMTAPDVELELRGREVRGGELAFSSMQATLSGPLTRLAAQATLVGTHREHPLSLALAATGDVATANRSIVVQRLSAAYREEEAHLAAPLEIRLSGDGGAMLSGLDLALPAGGRISGSAELRSNAIVADVAAQQIQMRLANLFAETPVSAGILAGRVKARTGGGDAGLDATVQLTGMRFANAPPDIAALEGTLAARWDGRRLAVEASASGLEQPLRLRAEIPLVPGPGVVPVLPPGAELAAELAWSGELEPLFALAPLPDHLVAGRAVVDIAVRGPPDAAVFSGRLEIDDGRYEHLLAGTVLENLKLTADLRDRQSVTFTATADDGVRGRLEVNGEILRPLSAPALDVRISLADLLVVRGDAMIAQSSGEIALRGGPERIDVTGRLMVQQAEIRLVNPLPPSVVDLGEIEIKGAVRPEETASTGTGSADVRLDVSVDLPGQVFVRGRGLDSEWGGSVAVGGSAASPVVTGRIESRRGQLDLVGRIFQLAKGRVVLDGRQPIDPSVAIRFERSTGDFTGRIDVGGTAAAPTLAFSSTPAVSEDEVLPRVLFGRSFQQLSAPEAIQLAAGIATLTSGKAGVLDRARGSFGLDVLRIEAGEGDESSSVTVGRYVREGVYVGAKESLDGTTGSVVVEVELPRNIVLDADVERTGAMSVGVMWRKDF